MKAFILLLLLLIPSVQAQYCTINRDITNINGLYLVEYSSTQELDEVTIIDSPTKFLSKDNIFNYSCRHSKFLMGQNQVKIYIPGEYLGFQCSYMIRTNKTLDFKGYARTYIKDFGVIDCQIATRHIYTQDLRTSKLILYWLRLNKYLRTL